LLVMGFTKHYQAMGYIFTHIKILFGSVTNVKCKLVYLILFILILVFTEFVY